MGTVLENSHFGSRFHFSLAVLDFETPTKQFARPFGFFQNGWKTEKTRFEKVLKDLLR